MDSPLYDDWYTGLLRLVHSEVTVTNATCRQSRDTEHCVNFINSCSSGQHKASVNTVVNYFSVVLQRH